MKGFGTAWIVVERQERNVAEWKGRLGFELDLDLQRREWLGMPTHGRNLVKETGYLVKDTRSFNTLILYLTWIFVFAIRSVLV